MVPKLGPARSFPLEAFQELSKAEISGAESQPSTGLCSQVPQGLWGVAK